MRTFDVKTLLAVGSLQTQRGPSVVVSKRTPLGFVIGNVRLCPCILSISLSVCFSLISELTLDIPIAPLEGFRHPEEHDSSIGITFAIFWVCWAMHGIEMIIFSPECLSI